MTEKRPDPNAQAVIGYHERTKHHFHRTARSAGYMDWENQPNPFRFYEGRPPISLPFLKKDPPGGHHHLYIGKTDESQPFALENIGGFLELSLGLSAWKAVGQSRWSLRINPSSGNLHPTEAHLILPETGDTGAGVYHYNPLLHGLELRGELPEKLREELSEHFGKEGFLIGLSSIFWRESWKYGERAFRYCNHDVGHALACLSFAANLFGWKATAMTGLSEADAGRMLGFHRTHWPPHEAEVAEIICRISPAQGASVPEEIPDRLLSKFDDIDWIAAPNALSREHMDWGVIDETAEATAKPATSPMPCGLQKSGFHIETPPVSLTAAEIIRQRRSAVAFRPEGSISRDRFLSMLDKTLPRAEQKPFDLCMGPAEIDLLLFVHGVDDMDPGLYYFIRTGKRPEDLQGRFKREFRWKPVQRDFPLYLLKKGDCRETATTVSCNQDIAGMSHFSLGMIARFREVVEAAPYRYRHLFWESGMIGQIFYLEAEAHGLRGTGIGCFFDDPVHEVLGLSGDEYQSLYHFTVGNPVEDPRLSTYPPYAHLKQKD